MGILSFGWLKRTFQASRFQYCVECARRDIQAQVSRHGNDPRAIGVEELAVIAARAPEHPTVPLEQADQLPDFH
jgi:hypothetical protein